MPPLVPPPTLADNIGDTPCSIAFALRCAQRVAPLYVDYYPGCSSEARTAIFDALEVVESTVQSLSRKVVSSARVSALLRTVSPELRPVIETIIAACKAADLYRNCTSPKYQQDAVEWNAQFIWPEVVIAALKAFESSQRIRRFNREIDISSEIHRDFLIARAEANHRCDSRKGNYFQRTDDKPVHPSLFGLLWPDDPPLGWESLLVQSPAQTVRAVPTNPLTGAPLMSGVADDPELARVRIVESFHHLVVKAFTEGDLAQLVAFKLNIRLDQIVTGKNFGEVVFGLLQWAEQRGRLRKLTTAIALAREGNPGIQAAANALLQIEP